MPMIIFDSKIKLLKIRHTLFSEIRICTKTGLLTKHNKNWDTEDNINIMTVLANNNSQTLDVS